MVKIARVVPEISSRTDRHTDRETDVLITILRHSYREQSSQLIYVCAQNSNARETHSGNQTKRRILYMGMREKQTQNSIRITASVVITAWSLLHTYWTQFASVTRILSFTIDNRGYFGAKHTKSSVHRSQCNKGKGKGTLFV